MARFKERGPNYKGGENEWLLQTWDKMFILILKPFKL
jgi:hypothetical protein